MKMFKNKIMGLGILCLWFVAALAHAERTDSVYWGVFEEGLHTDFNKLQAYGTQMGKSPSLVMWYISWQTSGFPLEQAQQVYDQGYIPHIVWEPWMGLDDILSGKWDGYLQSFGESLKQYGHPVMLRFAHEFNGDWYPWVFDKGVLGGTVTKPERWIQAYQYVHDKVASAGGKNAIWLWSPNVGNGGKNPYDITSYYPGDAYVDWIAVDGYNWGTSQSWSSWQSFSQVFGPIYQKLVANYPGKPIMIGEFGCSSTGETVGHDKAAWITDTFDQLNNNYPNIKAFIWFNLNKETDWRFNTSPQSTAAFKAGIQQPFIGSDREQLLALTGQDEASSSTSSSSQSKSSLSNSSVSSSTVSSAVASSSQATSSAASSKPAANNDGKKSGGGALGIVGALLLSLVILLAT
jgi:hypothetical protein